MMAIPGLRATGEADDGSYLWDLTKLSRGGDVVGPRDGFQTRQRVRQRSEQAVHRVTAVGANKFVAGPNPASDAVNFYVNALVRQLCMCRISPDDRCSGRRSTAARHTSSGICEQRRQTSGQRAISMLHGYCRRCENRHHAACDQPLIGVTK